MLEVPIDSIRFTALQRGIEREKERPRGKPFISLSLRHEFDYDGLTEYLELVEGFDDKALAILNARRYAEGSSLSR